MVKGAKAAVWLLVWGMLLASPPVLAAATQATPSLPVDRLIVRFKAPADVQARQWQRQSVAPTSELPALQRLAWQHRLPGRLLRPLANGAHVVQLDQPHSPQAVAAVLYDFRLDPDVESVEPDLRMLPAALPTDPLYSTQWALSEATGGIRPQQAWDISSGQGAVVAILDTGVLPHADLTPNLLPGYDFVSSLFMANDGNGRDADASDPGDGVAANGCGTGFPTEDEPSSWHGTHVAGIAAAQAFNGIGGSGAAPQASILPVRVLGRCGGYTSDIVDAIYWAAGLPVAGVPANSHPAQVINLSLSSPATAVCGPSYANAIAAARAAGTLVVVAAGNLEGSADNYPPGNCAGAFTVAATTRQGGRAYYSNYGSVVDLAAPGGSMQVDADADGILSTANAGETAPAGDDYRYLQGTSMAAPFAAGTAALLYAANPDLAVDAVESTLRDSARAFPRSCLGCGTGLLDASAALALVAGTAAPDPIADLALVLKGTTGKFVEDNANPGQGTILYRAEVSNRGPDIATAVTLANAFPDTVLGLDSINPGQGSCNETGTQCELGDLASGVTVAVTIRVRTTSDKKMDFQGQVDSEAVDPDLTNNFVIKRMGGSLGLLLLPLLLVLLARRFRYRGE